MRTRQCTRQHTPVCHPFYLLQNDDIILMIDEVHTLIGAGAAEGAIDAANILKPALARGELQVRELCQGTRVAAVPLESLGWHGRVSILYHVSVGSHLLTLDHRLPARTFSALAPPLWTSTASTLRRTLLWSGKGRLAPSVRLRT